jgi:hypothetical protein
MPTMAEVRQKYPQYSDMSDADLAGALHKKYYSDMPFEEFSQKIGMGAEEHAAASTVFGRMKASNELVAHATTGLAGGLAGGLGYLGTLVGTLGNTGAAQAVQQGIQEKLTYQPRTPLGQTYANRYASAAQWLGQKEGEFAGENVAELTGSPLLGAGANVGANVLTGVLTGGAATAGVRGAVRAGSRKLPVLSNAPTSVGAAASAPQSSALASASPVLQQAVTRLASRGKNVNRDVLARHMDADTLPVPVKLTRGQATQDPIIVSQERNMRAADEAYARTFNEQNKGLIDNVTALRDEAGPNVFSTNPVEHGDTLIAAYRAQDAVAEARISALYKQLRDESGGGAPVDAKALLQKATDKLHERLLFDDAPASVMSTLNRLSESRNMTFENFESLRTNLATIQRTATDGNARAAAGVIRGAMEELPLFPGSGAARLKPIADAARKAHRERAAALEADPAYEAAVNGTVSPDRFVGRFIINASRDEVATMRANLAQNTAASETMGVAAIDYLRTQAGVDGMGNGVFSQARFNKSLEGLSPKIRDLVSARVAENLEKLGRVSRYIQAQPAGSFVNNSNTLTAAMGKGALRTAEGVANVAAGGIPIGSAARALIERGTRGRQVRKSMEPGAGLDYIN